MQWAHDGFGRMTEDLRVDKTTTTTRLTRTKEDGTWRVRLATESTGGADLTTEFDGRRRPVKWLWHGPQIPAQKCPSCAVSYPVRLMSRVLYDDLGEHVVRRSLPAGEFAAEDKLLDDQFQYDALGRLIVYTAPWGAETRYAYFPGFTEIHDPSGLPSFVDRDPLGRTLNVIDKAGGVTSYSDGPFGLPRTVTIPDGTASVMTRNAWGRVIALDDPDQGETESRYNGFGALVTTTDAAGRTVERAYDSLGRLVLRTDKQDDVITALTSWTWDTATHGMGALAEVTSPDGKKRYAYDALSRLEAATLHAKPAALLKQRAGVQREGDARGYPPVRAGGPPLSRSPISPRTTAP